MFSELFKNTFDKGNLETGIYFYRLRNESNEKYFPGVKKPA